MNAPVTVVKIKNQRSEPQNSPHEVRTAYPYFHEKRTKNAAGVPYTKKDGSPNPRYSSTFMFPKLAADAAQCANYMFLWGLAQEAAKKQWPTSVDANSIWFWPAGAQYAVKDGDVPFISKPKPGQPVPTAEQVAAKNAWRRGYWIIEAENFLDPGPRIAKIVNGFVHDLLAKNVNGIVQYKSGDWGYPNLHAYGYEHETFGVNFGFDGFCFTREGEAIGSSGPRSASQMFEGVAGTVAQPATVMPGAGPMPPQQYAAPVAQGYVAPGPTAGAPQLPAPTAAYVAPAAPVGGPQYVAPPSPPLAPMPPAAPAAPMPPMPPVMPALPR